MTDWDRIVGQHGPMVWRTVYRFLNDYADASDCFQATFLAAFEFVSQHAVRNWTGLLKKLASARALDRLRVRYRERDRNTALPDEGLVSKLDNPSEAFEEAELAQQLREALATLDKRQAEVFALVNFADLSYREVAEQLGLSVNHVGVLLNRARSELRERLAEYNPTSENKESRS